MPSAALIAVLGLLAGCGTPTRGSAGAGTGASAGANGTAGAAGNGQAGSAAGSGAAGVGNAGTAADGGVQCPPCVAPPSPHCVGSGPCGCGPYTCPWDSDGGACPDFDESFLALLKACDDDSDCETVTHQRDCCGTQAIPGIARAARERFDECVPKPESFPLCDCVSQPTRTDDGRPIEGSEGDGVTARCVSGQCSSYAIARACGDAAAALACKHGDICAAIETVPGVASSVRYECSPNPCVAAIDCTCGQSACGQASEDLPRDCALSSSPLSDLYCTEP